MDEILCFEEEAELLSSLKRFHRSLRERSLDHKLGTCTRLGFHWWKHLVFAEFTDQLDASLKKNTTFKRNLSTMTTTTKDEVLEDLNKVNITKFLQEIANIICTSLNKKSEVISYVEVSSINIFSSELILYRSRVLFFRNMEKNSRVKSCNKPLLSFRSWIQRVTFRRKIPPWST